jgi:hypothetical protein
VEESDIGEREYSCDGRGEGVLISADEELPLRFGVDEFDESDEGEK